MGTGSTVKKEGAAPRRGKVVLVFLPEDKPCRLADFWEEKGKGLSPNLSDEMGNSWKGTRKTPRETTVPQANQAEGTGGWRDVTERPKTIPQPQNDSHWG